MELESYFKKFASSIEPSENARDEAITGHRTLRGRLEKDDDLSETHIDTFLIGSYARNTAVHPVKDVDIVVILDLNPKSDSPESTLRMLKRVLNKYYEAKTADQRRSIRIDLSYITMDVIPAVAPYDTNKPLLIPDRKLEKWIWTHPREHIALTTERNKASNERFVPMVKMVKWWHAYQVGDVERPKPKGFTLECLVGMYMDFDAASYAKAFISVLEGVQGAYETLDEILYIPDPALRNVTVPTGLTQAEFDRFMNTVEESLELSRRGLAAGSAELWRQVFGSKFPPPPQKESGARRPRPLKDQPFF